MCIIKATLPVDAILSLLLWLISLESCKLLEGKLSWVIFQNDAPVSVVQEIKTTHVSLQ